MVTEPQLDPQSLVARIIAELEANPEAQRLLLRALLTNEFLGMPTRLDAIEKDIAELKVDVAQLKVDVAQLKTDVAYLKGSDLENRLHRRIRARVTRPFGLKRPRIMQSPLLEPITEFTDQMDDALEDGRISEEQDGRIEETDFIIRAQRISDQSPVWIAVEASNRVGESDIQRARLSADILAAVFQMETIPVVAGYSIDPRDLARADADGVKYVGIQVPIVP
jgi:hypothetical protein